MRSISCLSREWLLNCNWRFLFSPISPPQTALNNLDKRPNSSEHQQRYYYHEPVAVSRYAYRCDALKLIASDIASIPLLRTGRYGWGKIPVKMSFPLVVFIMLPVVGIIVANHVVSLYTNSGGL
ncbi:hypothetical protein OH492_14260 [Vibrio chagasii]|nr:hypothetical protein [Vibrio chagasii]